LAFLDEEETLSSSGGRRPPRRPPPDHQRQILVRRAIGVGVVVVLLILLVLGVRGCLNARTQRGFENYASDLNGIATQSNQLSVDFFKRLNDPGNLSPLQFEAEVKADRGTAESLAARVGSLSTPGDLNDAQNKLNLAFQERRDGLTGIADQISTALGDQGSNEADKAIADYMKYFLASDVLYAQAQTEINASLKDQGISQQAPDSVFLPDTSWLDQLKVSSALAAVSTSSSATSGVHGLGLSATMIGSTTLEQGTPITVSNASELQVQVQNQGDSDESDVQVSFEITGGTQTISGDGTISKIAAGATQTAKIPIQPAPDTGQQLTLEVTVQPVAGEQVASNNRGTYQVTFK
jgi:CARDB